MDLFKWIVRFEEIQREFKGVSESFKECQWRFYRNQGQSRKEVTGNGRVQKPYWAITHSLSPGIWNYGWDPHQGLLHAGDRGLYPVLSFRRCSLVLFFWGGNVRRVSPHLPLPLHPGPVCVLVAQSYPTLSNPVVCSPLGSSVHGILQTRILEWVAIPFSRGSSQPRD